MQDDETTLYNTCTDLVSMRKNKAFPLHLLGSRRAGEWICVHELCQNLGMAPDEIKPGLYATWLADPLGHDAYVVVMFYDDESKWSMAAHYNRGRLLGDAAPDKTMRVETVASAFATSQQAIPSAG